MGGSGGEGQGAGKTLTINEAAAELGISEKAVRRRIERGTLPAVRGHDGRRRIPVSAIAAARGAPVPLRGPRPQDSLEADLLDRLERQSTELGRLRALTDGSERRERELEEQLHAERARALAAELREAQILEQLAAARAEADRPRGLFRRKRKPPAELPGADAP